MKEFYVLLPALIFVPILFLYNISAAQKIMNSHIPTRSQKIMQLAALWLIPGSVLYINTIYKDHTYPPNSNNVDGAYSDGGAYLSSDVQSSGSFDSGSGDCGDGGAGGDSGSCN